MQSLPAPNLRKNLGTWCVPTCCLPAVAHVLHDALKNEPWDPHFLGQSLETTYFDTPGFALRKARAKGDKYLTLRIRCYAAAGQDDLYALSAKTESEKWRQEIAPDQAEAVLKGLVGLEDLLPGNLLARLMKLDDGGSLCPVVKVCCRRYAVEDATDRLTLDVGVHTDTGKCLSAHVLEFKSTDGEALPPGPLALLRLRPIKLSKFLWATCL